MGILEGKKILVTGVLTEASIAGQRSADSSVISR